MDIDRFEECLSGVMGCLGAIIFLCAAVAAVCGVYLLVTKTLFG